MRQHVRLTAALERDLLAISPRQLDRRLRPYTQRSKRRLYGTTRPGSLLKHMIPMKTDHWDVTTPGSLEIDLVSHAGASAAGDCIYTLDCVDIQTGWVERQAVKGKGREGILRALQTIEQQLPFPLRGIDSANGSEFINTHLLAFCQRPDGQTIQFTRSRPYKQDDNAHVEQKNWTHVRKLIGWDRYDSSAALQAMHALYDELRSFQTLFQPSMKLLLKVRNGSRPAAAMIHLGHHLSGFSRAPRRTRPESPCCASGCSGLIRLRCRVVSISTWSACTNWRPEA